MMDRIGLEENFIRVVNKEGKASFGGNQNWFADVKWHNIHGQGCGLIAAVDTYLYLSNHRSISKEDYLNIINDYLSKRFVMKLFLHEFSFLKNKSIAIGIVPRQIVRFLRKKLKKEARGYKFKWNGRHGTRKMYEKMKSMLEKNVPVVWGLYSSGKFLKLYKFNHIKNQFVDNYLLLTDGKMGHNTTNSHYVTATAIIETPTATKHQRMVEISSWGDRFYIDFDEYLAYVGNSKISKYCSNILILR
ncbi:MAG: hypothetical protein K5769_02080 [Pseudobutyrivibrio sp.]|nr:hypothetical protein [Pseudobutyrivibrio sp.]